MSQFFTTDNRAATWLNSLGVQFEYREDLVLEDLASQWDKINHGRPDGQCKVDDAIDAYLDLMKSGSPAPAVIVYRIRTGLDVLDGVQRLCACRRGGGNRFCGYIVECQQATAEQIRLSANLRFAGQAPPNEQFCLEGLVNKYVLDSNFTAQDVVMFTGSKLSTVNTVLSQCRARRRIENLFDGSAHTPEFKLQVLETIDKSFEAEDYKLASAPLKNAFALLEKCKFKNGQLIPLIKEFSNIKRIGNKNRETQFRSKQRTLAADPTVKSALLRAEGGIKHDAITNISSAIKSLHTRIKEHGKSRSKFDNIEIIQDWNLLVQDCCRMLREQCSTEVRRAVDPFHVLK